MATKKTEANGDLIGLMNSRLTLAKTFGKDWLNDCKKWDSDYMIQTLNERNISIQLDNQIQVPYIFSSIEAQLPSIFENLPYLLIKQRGKLDKEFSEFTNNVWDYVVDKTQLEEKINQTGINFLITGIGELKYGWRLETETVEEKTEQPILNSDGTPTGEVQEIINKVQVPVVDQPLVEVPSYKRMFYSPESVFVTDDDDNKIPYIIEYQTKSADDLESEYGVRPIDGESAKLNLTEIDQSLSAIDGNRRSEILEGDLDRVDVFTYSGVLPKVESEDENWRSKKVYRVVFTNKRVIKKPEVLTKKQYCRIGNYGLPTRFWKFGEPKVMRELEQDISLGRSRIMDIRDKQGTKIALPVGTEVDEIALKKSADFTIMRFTGNQPPMYVTPPPISDTIIRALDMSREEIQMASAQMDISRGGMTNTVDTATGQKIFQAASEKRINRKRQKIGNLIKALAINLLVLCAENWSIETFSKITDLSPEEIEQKQYIEQLKQLGEQFSVTFEVDSITNNREAISAQAIALYRETKDDPLANHDEILKNAIKIGFNSKEPDRFLANNFSPEQIMAMVQYMIQMNIINPEMGNGLIMATQQALAQAGNTTKGTGDVGRPARNTPTDIMAKSMEGSDTTQINAQAQAAFKQAGTPKGPQGI